MANRQSWWKRTIEQTIMKSDFDRRKTLTELEGQDWGPPNFESHLVTTIHQLRHKPLERFTVADLQIFIGQNMCLEFLLPIAIEHLQDDPLVEGDYYCGDLLVAVLRAQNFLAVAMIATSIHAWKQKCYFEE